MTWWSPVWTVDVPYSGGTPRFLAARVDEAQAVIDRLTRENTELRVKLARLEGRRWFWG